jgi:hypothetical protein
MDYGIQAKTAEMKRAVWVSPRDTTRLVIHASRWPTKEAAEIARDQIAPLNPNITFTVKAIS